MSLNHQTARRHLDEKFAHIKNVKALSMPPKGWIKAIRNALGITVKQLAQKLSLSHQRITVIEKDEISGNLKMSTLERVADALGCDLVYTFVPRRSLEDMALSQAAKKAGILLGQAEHTMSLENQGSSKKNNLQLENLIQELLKGPQSRLWDED